MSAFLQIRLEKRRPIPRMAVMANMMLRVPLKDVISYTKDLLKLLNYHRCWYSEHAKCAGTCRVKQATYFLVRDQSKISPLVTAHC